MEEEVTRLKRENESACGHHSNKHVIIIINISNVTFYNFSNLQKPPTSPAEIDSSGTFDVRPVVSRLQS